MPWCSDWGEATTSHILSPLLHNHLSGYEIIFIQPDQMTTLAMAQQPLITVATSQFYISFSQYFHDSYCEGTHRTTKA